MLAFNDPRVVSLIKEQFIAVAGDDWYQRRRNDPTGRYLRYIVRQTDSIIDRETWQGVYVFTARGKLLAYRIRTRSVEDTLRKLTQALHRWNQLPAHQTRPNSFDLPEMPDDIWDARYAPKPPSNSLVLNVYTRCLEHDDSGALQRWGQDVIGSGTALDHVWLREPEWRDLVALAETSDSFDLPREVAMRIARFHLVDNTRGEPDHWKRHQIHQLSFRGQVVARDAGRLVVELRGEFVLATDKDPSLAQRGFAGELIGELSFDYRQDRFTAVRLAAIGDHWGESRYTPGAREGRTPLGVFLVAEDDPKDVPPQAFRSPDRYFGASFR